MIAAQAEIADAAVEFVHHAGIEGVEGHEADEFFRVGIDERGGVVVDQRGRVDEVAIVDVASARIGGDVETDRAVDRLHGIEVIVPGVDRAGGLVWSPDRIDRVLGGWRFGAVAGCMGVDVDDHWRFLRSGSLFKMVTILFGFQSQSSLVAGYGFQTGLASG